MIPIDHYADTDNENQMYTVSLILIDYTEKSNNIISLMTNSQNNLQLWWDAKLYSVYSAL